jgi:nitrite reductase/ring-hydroxylating ferredoxin subunit
LKRLCASEDLPPGASIRFPLEPPRAYAEEGFAHRAPDGTVRAWVNVCPHRAQPVDLGDGKLFNAAGEIECQAHGARFDPSTGACAGGPCFRNGLRPLAVVESQGEVRVANGIPDPPNGIPDPPSHYRW